MNIQNPYQPPPIADHLEELDRKRQKSKRDGNRIVASFLVCAAITLSSLLMLIAFQEEGMLPVTLAFTWMTFMIAIAWFAHRLGQRREF